MTKQSLPQDSTPIKSTPTVNDLFGESNNRDSFDPSFELFLSDANSYAKDREKMREYITSEIKRIALLGKSPLKALLQNLDFVNSVSSQDVFAVFEEHGISHTYIKLIDGATCPSRDPHGTLINEAYRGKVLVAKIGNAGGKVNINDVNDGTVSAKYSGSGRKLLFSSRKAYDIEVITQEPKKVAISKAVVLLMQWGFGVKPKRMIKLDVNKFQDQWLIEETSISDTYASIIQSGEINKYI